MPSPTVATYTSCTLSPQQQLQSNGAVAVAVNAVPCHLNQHVCYHHLGLYHLQTYGTVADRGHHDHSHGKAASIIERSMRMGGNHYGYHDSKIEVSATIASASMRLSCDHHVHHHSSRVVYHHYRSGQHHHNIGRIAPSTSLHRRNGCSSHHSHGEAIAAFATGFDGSRRRIHIISRASSNASINAPRKNEHVAILWFKKDLRLDDHPGLCSSAAYCALLPVYVFDPHLLRGWSKDMLEALVEAVADLKRGLQGLGSDLIIRRGSTKAELCALTEEVKASAIITEKEIEHEWRETLFSIIEKCLQGSTTGSQKPKVEIWEAPLYEVDDKHSPASYKEFQKMRCPTKSPVQAPTSLPAVPDVLEKGCVPAASLIEEDVRIMLENNIWHKKLKDLQNSGAEAFLSMKYDKQGGAELLETKGGVFEGFNNWRERYILASPYEALNKRREELAMYSKEEEPKNGSGVGATSTMGILEAYLRFLEPTWRKDWKVIHEAVAEAESKGPKGASFRVLFGNSLTLGTISRRRIYHESFEYEKARNGGWSSPFGFSTFTAAAAVQEVKSAEWYRMLATASEEDTCVRIWCWRGYLIQYNAKGGHGLPIVLVHGFGAFGEHYRDNMENLAKKGNRVWALTLLGFGRSEKPDIAYTELLWAELIRDFLVEVVGEPAVVVGNSIGGYMVSMVAGLWPEIVKSLILLNTAGGIVPDYLSHTYVKPSGRTGITWAGSQLSLSYLRSAASQLLRKYYSVNPSRVDEWLVGEILRASYDPGAAIVLESFYCLKNPFPINWFLDRYKGKVFVIQGIKDPLSNSTERKKLFESYCSNAVVEMVDAGHCPHDEIPEKVNALIVDWLERINLLQADSATSQAVQCV